MSTFDVHLELDPGELAAESDPVRTIAELSRKQAEDFAAEHNVTLRHPDPIEVHHRTGQRVVDGKDVMVIASRWVTDPK